jgi:hypothetical protein
LQAERLLLQHGSTTRLRTLNALQLAVALDVHRRDAPIDLFVAGDNALCEIAAAEGLSTGNLTDRPDHT